MTSAALMLENFDQLLTTPASVEQLNAAILQLAVQGKLVPQDLNDEPASALLKRIRAEKARLGKAEKLPPVQENEKPFELPEGWEWVKLSHLSHNIHYGYTASADFASEDYRLLRITDIQNSRVDWDTVPGCEIGEDEASKYLLREGDILIARTGGTIGKSYLVESLTVKAVFASYLIRVMPLSEIASEYLKVFLDSPMYWQQLIEKSQGTGQPNVNATSLGQLLLPFPPLAEQHRIVARVEQLLAQTRQLAEGLAHAQHSLDHVTEAALGQLLAAATPAEFSARWDFIAQHFDSLFTAPEHIAPLRQAVLELAVHGKLTRREPGDEPVSELFKRITAEKAKSGKAEKLSSVQEDEKPFELPEGWEWVRFKNVLLDLQTGPFGSNLHKSDYVPNGIPVINPANMRNGKINASGEMMISESTRERLKQYTLHAGDLVMARRGEMGRCALVTQNEDGWLCGTGSLRLRLSENISKQFVFLLFQSNVARAYLNQGAVGITMVNLSQTTLEHMPMALPSLAEQHRIVARVEALLQQCDALEAKLRAEQAARETALGALIAHLGTEAVAGNAAAYVWPGAAK